jgi:hypothetical protein
MKTTITLTQKNSAAISIDALPRLKVLAMASARLRQTEQPVKVGMTVTHKSYEEYLTPDPLSLPSEDVATRPVRIATLGGQPWGARHRLLGSAQICGKCHLQKASPSWQDATEVQWREALRCCCVLLSIQRRGPRKKGRSKLVPATERPSPSKDTKRGENPWRALVYDLTRTIA